MEELGLDFSGAIGDIGGEILGNALENALEGAGNRLARQLVSSSGNQVGGVVLQAPGTAGLPLQAVSPTVLTTVSNPAYQVQTQPVHHVVPGSYAQPVNFAQPVNIHQPLNNGAAVVFANPGLPAVQTVQPLNHVYHNPTMLNTGVPAQGQRPVVMSPVPPRPVVVPPVPPPNWMGLSIFTVICCTLPFGIIAIMFSCMVNDSLRCGRYQSAQKNSNIAKWLNVLAIISGLPLYGVVVYLLIKPSL